MNEEYENAVKIAQLCEARLKLGAWYVIRGPIILCSYCVTRIQGEMVILTYQPFFLPKIELKLSKSELFSTKYNPVFIGYGKKRWIRCILNRVLKQKSLEWAEPHL